MSRMDTPALYIIATPIGNLEDITLRAVSILKNSVGMVACEDTRQTKKLLDRYGIAHPIRSLHTHSSENRVREIVNILLEGTSVAYLTDSGTPGLSDPGARLVAAAREAGVRIVPVPGCSALAAIVSVSGSMSKRIVFGGFLSKKEGKRKTELLELGRIPATIILYESPYRIRKLLAAIAEVFPGRMVLIGREMTKLHEEFIFNSIENIMKEIHELKEKGEFTIAILNGESGSHV